MLNKFLKYLFILYFTIFSVTPSFASGISPLTLPTGGQVASGNININESAPGKLVVNQTTNQGIINWQSFNVGVDAAVHFNTPNASAGTLNNISGGTSTILGSIFSNGRLFFANPSGIIFKPGSQVKAEGLVASAMKISNQDFLANNFNFTNNQITSLQNEGNLEAQYVALIAPQVLNKGTITTNVATMIAAGDDVKLSISDSNRLSVNINPAKIKTLSSNEGVIKSENGTVSIQANAAQELVDQTINTPRSADSLISENGVIKLVSNSGSIKAKNVNLSAGRLGGTEVSGTIDASSNAKGGDIEITGKEIQVKSNSKLLAMGETGGGNILVGGDWQGSNGVLQATYTTVEKDTLIDVSSTGVGDGGKIVVWSDIHNPNSKTMAKGKLYAKANVGDGGKIETSGYALDIENADPNTLSIYGKAGNYLIDPYNYTINSDDWSNINSALNSSDVTINTNGAGYGSNYGRSNGDDLSGRIEFNPGNRIYTGSRDATLTLTAANNVEINADIRTESKKLNITANADYVFGIGDLNLRDGVFTANTSSNTSNTYSGVLSNLSLIKSGSGTLTLSGANTYSGETTISAGTLSVTGTLGSGTYAGNITNSATLAMGSSSNQTLSGVISGTGALTKSELGTLTLSGANTYSGATTVSAGTLAVTANNALGTNAAGTTVASGANLDFQNINYSTTEALTVNGGTIKTSTGTSTVAGTIALGANSTFDVGGTSLTSSGVISGTGALTKSGSGTLTLSGANTYSGATTVSAGTLAVTANNALGTNAAGTTVASGANLDFQNINYSTTEALTVNGGTIKTSTGTSTVAGTIALGANSTFDVGGTSLTSSGVISGTGALTKSGSGTLTLSGANTYSGATTVSAGTLSVTGTLGSGTYAGNITNSATLAMGSSSNQTLSGVISGTGALTKSELGTLTLSGANTYSGATTVSAGTLAVTANNALGTNAAGTTVASGANLDFQNINYSTTEALTVNGGTIKTSTGTSTVAGTIALGANSTFDVGGTSLTSSGVISGTGALTKSGSGTLTLSGANTYSGATTVSAGTLAVTANNALGTNAAGTTVASGANLDFQNINYSTTEALTVNGGTIKTSTGTSTVAGTIALGANSTFDVGGTSLTSSGVISGTGALTKSGSGTLTLSGANTYSGATTVSAGTLSVTGTLGSGTYAGNITNSATLAMGSSSNQTLSGVISGTGALTKSGSGTLTLSGANTYSGGTTLTTGQISLGISQSSSSTSGALGTGALTMNGGTLGNTSSYGSIYNDILVNTGTTSTLKEIAGSNLYLAGNITGSGTLQVDNTSGWSVTLAGDNSGFTGTYTQPSTTNGNTGFYSSTAGSANASWELSAGRFVNEFSGGNISLGSLYSNATSGYLLGSSGGNNNASYTIGGKNLNSTFTGTIENNYPGASNNVLSITKSGTGTLTLSGTNTYTGATTISAGTLSVTGTLGSGTYAGNITNSATLAMGSSSNQTLSGVISGTGALTKSGSGTLTLSGANTYSGATTVSAGTLSVTGTLGSGTYAGNITNSATLAMGSSSNQTLSGVISGTGALTKSGSGTLTLSGANTYSGATTISAGTLSASSLADTTAVNVASGATYQLDQNDTVASIAGAGNINLQARTLTSAGASDTNFSGIISGTGGLTLTGSNNLTLSGANTYSGTTHINGGGLVLANSNALPSNSITSTSGRLKTTERVSDLTVAGNVTLIGDVATSGAQTYNNNVTIESGSAANPLTISSQNSDITFSGTVKTGSGAKAAQRSLTVNAGTGNVNFNDRIGYAFNGVGFNAGLTADSPYALSVTGGNITLKGDVMTFETQTYNGAVKIGGNGSNGTTRTLLSMDPKITFNGTVDDTQTNTHTLVAKAVQIRNNVLVSGAPEVNFNRSVSSITSLAGYQGLTGYQIVSNEFGSIDPSASFGTVRLPSSSSSSSSSSSTSQAEQRNIEKKISSLKTNIANSSSSTKTGMTLSQLFSSFKPQAGTSFVKSIEIVYSDSPNFGAGKINQNLPADVKSNNNLNQNKSNQTKPNNQQNQKQNSSGGINDDERL